MIAARLTGGAALTRGLAARAEKLAMARAERAIRARREDDGRWRSARLLWPLFGDSR